MRLRAEKRNIREDTRVLGSRCTGPKGACQSIVEIPEFDQEEVNWLI